MESSDKKIWLAVATLLLIAAGALLYTGRARLPAGVLDLLDDADTEPQEVYDLRMVREHYERTGDFAYKTIQDAFEKHNEPLVLLYLDKVSSQPADTIYDLYQSALCTPLRHLSHIASSRLYDVLVPIVEQTQPTTRRRRRLLALLVLLMYERTRADTIRRCCQDQALFEDLLQDIPEMLAPVDDVTTASMYKELKYLILHSQELPLRQNALQLLHMLAPDTAYTVMTSLTTSIRRDQDVADNSDVCKLLDFYVDCQLAACTQQSDPAHTELLITAAAILEMTSERYLTQLKQRIECLDFQPSTMEDTQLQEHIHILERCGIYPYRKQIDSTLAVLRDYIDNLEDVPTFAYIGYGQHNIPDALAQHTPHNYVAYDLDDLAQLYPDERIDHILYNYLIRTSSNIHSIVIIISNEQEFNKMFELFEVASKRIPAILEERTLLVVRDTPASPDYTQAFVRKLQANQSSFFYKLYQQHRCISLQQQADSTAPPSMRALSSSRFSLRSASQILTNFLHTDPADASLSPLVLRGLMPPTQTLYLTQALNIYKQCKRWLHHWRDTSPTRRSVLVANIPIVEAIDKIQCILHGQQATEFASFFAKYRAIYPAA